MARQTIASLDAQRKDLENRIEEFTKILPQFEKELQDVCEDAEEILNQIKESLEQIKTFNLDIDLNDLPKNKSIILRDDYGNERRVILDA